MYCIDMETIRQPLFSKYHELINPDKDKKEIVTYDVKHFIKPKEDDLIELIQKWKRNKQYLEEKRRKIY